MRHLLNGLEGALHIAETYLQIDQKIADHPRLVQKWLGYPTRQSMTRDRFQPLRGFVELVLTGQTVDSNMLQTLEFYSSQAKLKAIASCISNTPALVWAQRSLSKHHSSPPWQAGLSLV